MKLIILVSGFTFISSTAALAQTTTQDAGSAVSQPTTFSQPTTSQPLVPQQQSGLQQPMQGTAPATSAPQGTGNTFIINESANPAYQLTPTTLMDEKRRARNREEGNPDDLPTSGTTQ